MSDSASNHLFRWNNKRSVLYHELIVKIHGEKIFQENLFEIEECGSYGRFRNVNVKELRKSLKMVI